MDFLEALKQRAGGAIGSARDALAGLMEPKLVHSFRREPAVAQAAEPSSLPLVSPDQPGATPAPSADPREIERKIRAGFRAYNKGQPLPMEEHIPALVAAAQRYPIFAQNPYLIAAVSLNETSGGKNWTHLNNPVSWGVRVKDKYQPQSSAQAIEDMITAVGGDPNRGAGFDPETAKSRMQTAGYYKQFRDTNDLKAFSETFEPAANNPDYYDNLVKFIQMFEQQ